MSQFAMPSPVAVATAAALLLLVPAGHGLSTTPINASHPRQASPSAASSSIDISEQLLSSSPPPPPPSRRDVLGRVLAGGAAASAGLASGAFIGLFPCVPFSSPPPAANAASSTPPSPAELAKLQRGHSRVAYLLQNWESITSTCGSRIMSDTERKQVVRTEGGGGGSCDKDPLRVQEYLGYKSTEDPLFKADKLMVRAAPLVDPDNFEDYLDVVERYREKADQGAMMAYTSSWGEANPNGGKEVVDEYLERTKTEVEKTEVLLRKVLGYLDLELLSPSKSMK